MVGPHLPFRRTVVPVDDRPCGSKPNMSDNFRLDLDRKFPLFELTDSWRVTQANPMVALRCERQKVRNLYVVRMGRFGRNQVFTV